MKTLANCSPREFLAQTNKIRKLAADWIEKTRILEIRKQMPAITDEMTAEEIQEAARQQAKANIMKMLDAMLDEYPNETADLLGLVCFIDPEDLDNYQMVDIFKAATELISSQDVIDFFISLARLGLMDISTEPKT